MSVAAVALAGVGASSSVMALAGLVPALAPWVPMLGVVARLAATLVCAAFSVAGLATARDRLGRGDRGLALALVLASLMGIAAAALLARGSLKSLRAPAETSRGDHGDVGGSRDGSFVGTSTDGAASHAMVAPQPPRWAGASPKSTTSG